jgi:hypothetical protein
MRSRPPRWGTWLVAAGVVAASSLLGAAPKPPKPPSLLADVLKVEPSWRILDPALDLVGDYTQAKLEDLDRWPPWIEGDFDKDDKDDLAAVVVRRGASGEPEFAIIALHGRTRGRAELVVPFGRQRILAVANGIAEDTVMPMHCLECDANRVWYRWNGAAYEAWLYAVGETVRISSGDPGQRLTLFTDPRPDATRTAAIPLCVKAKVLEVGGRDGQRWYRVDVKAPGSPRGWIPQQLAVEQADCSA